MKKILISLMLFALCFGANELDFDTLSSDFKQTISSKTQKIAYLGYFVAHKDLGAFWHYKTPVSKLIYFNNKRVIILEPELEQAILTNLKDSPNLTSILSQAKMISKDTYETKFDDIIYTIKVKDGLPTSIDYTDKLDNQVTIELSKTRKNEPINQGLLEPQIPKDYDILSN